MRELYGREQELADLRAVFRTDSAKLVAIYGRRRIGKTALVHSAYAAHAAILEFEGLEDISTREQLKSCYHDLIGFFGVRHATKRLSNWQAFFDLLHSQLQSFDGKIVVFFDEFQWLAGMRSNLVAIFKKYWDSKFSKLKNCHFIICGSISSFIVKKVINSKALYGRIDKEVQLRPLTLKDCAKFFPHATPREEVLETYFVLGGVPKYYEMLDYSKSLQQNCEQLFFKQGGFFFSEKNKLFVSHFGANPAYQSIVNTLSSKSLDISEIAARTNLASGGSLSGKLEELTLAGFIRRLPNLKMRVRGQRYVVSDPFLRFYFSFIAPNLEKIISGQYNFHKDTQLNLRVWYGRAFEYLALDNYKLISDKLLFSGVEYTAGTWSPKNGKGQIDLVFLRDDRTLTICELKYSEKLSAQEIINEFKEKEAAIAEEFPRYRIHRVLLSGLAINPNTHSALSRYFHDVLEAEQVFV